MIRPSPRTPPLPRRIAASLALLALALTSSQALAIDDAHRTKANEMSAKAVEFLFSAQDKTAGGWNVPPPGARAPALPAITGLVLNGMLVHDAAKPDDPRIKLALDYILSSVKPDGGIYDVILPSYNTAICLSALSHIQDPRAAAAIAPAQDFLRSLQWSEQPNDARFESQEPGKDLEHVNRSHPFYGGVGYGHSGRPDLSNLSLMLDALHDSDVSPEDPAFQRAVVFLQRLQMLDAVNDMPYADNSRQGGFIYAPATGRLDIGKGESKAGTIEESMDDGTKVSRLRAYGSMTYAGFKSYLYAGLRRDDPRVTAAYEWIRRNYTLTENPGMGTDGLYYYFVTFSRAMNAWGEPHITVIKPDNTEEKRDWANDLVDRLAELQNPDGSFKSVDDRWMEDDPVLITAFALIALQHAAASN